MAHNVQEVHGINEVSKEGMAREVEFEESLNDNFASENSRRGCKTEKNKKTKN